MSPVLFLIVLSSLILYVQYKWKRRRLEKTVNKFNGPPTLPLLGNASIFWGPTSDSFTKFKNLLELYKSPFRIWLLHTPYIVIADTRNFQIVAQKMLDKTFGYKYLEEGLGNNMFLAEVEEWKPSRQLHIAGLGPNTLYTDSFIGIFHRQSKELVCGMAKEANTGQHFDLWPYLFPISVSKIARNAFGVNQSSSNEPLLNYCKAACKTARILSRRTYKPWYQPNIIYSIIKYLNGYQKIFDIALQYPRMLLKIRMNEYRCSNGTKAKDSVRDYFSILMEQYEKRVINDQELNDAVTGIIFAAGDTTAVTTGFVLLMLAMRPEIQNKVYEEVREVFGENDELPTLASLSKLHFLEQCIKETLRLFPTVPAVLRRAVKDLPLSDSKIIPSGANVLLSIIGIHRDPQIYPNPLVWDPHNFDPDKHAARPKGCFIPFSAGPRGCVGEKYASISMKIELSILLRYYKFSTEMRMEDIVLDVDILLRSTKGYMVKIESRT